MLRKSAFITTAAMGVALSQVAVAADLPQRPAYQPQIIVTPVYNWTGCYVGGNVGAAWGRADFNNTSNFSSASATNTGFAGGIQFGCDYQMGAWVIGARNMFDGTTLNSGTTFSNGYTGDSSTAWFDTLTARLGYAVQPNILLYMQGGGAWARSNQTIKNPGGSQVAQFASNKGGWTIGGGAEYMFAQRWTAFVEYNYVNLGTSTGSWTDAGGAHSVDIKRDAQILLVGVNYRF